MKRFPLLFVILLLISGVTFCADFGLQTDQRIEIGNSGIDYNVLSYMPTFTPWFSWNGSEGVSVYLSCLLSLKYNNYSGEFSENSGWKEPVLVPELTRFALSYRFNQSTSLEAGRIGYSDILNITVSGFFDGLRFEMITPEGTISFGAFYSGFLFRDTAVIIMTAEDANNYMEPWNYNKDEFGNYFASRRLLASVRYIIPVGESNMFYGEILAQFDLNGKDDALNSQYVKLNFDLFPLNTLRISAGVLFETMQNGNGNFFAAFGALMQTRIDLPTSISDWIGITIKFTSGAINDTFTVFKPINAIPSGLVFTGENEGIVFAGINYNARIIRSLFAEFAFNYFMRAYDSPEGIFYGGEFYTSFTWQPLEDVRLTAGGGVFFPQMGNLNPSGSDIIWKVSTGLSLSL